MCRGRREEVQECQQLIRFWPFFIRSSFEAKSRKKYRFVVDTIWRLFVFEKTRDNLFWKTFLWTFLQYSRLINVSRTRPRWPDKDDARCVWWLRKGFLKVKGTARLKGHNEIFNETITPRFCWTITTERRKEDFSCFCDPMLQTVYDKELYESFEQRNELLQKKKNYGHKNRIFLTKIVD